MRIEQEIRNIDKCIAKLSRDFGFVWSSMGAGCIVCVLGNQPDYGLTGVRMSVSGSSMDYTWEYWADNEMIASNWGHT